MLARNSTESKEYKAVITTRRRWSLVLGYIGMGFVLPWLFFLIACIRYRRLGEILDFPERLFAGGYNYFWIACFNAIPFVVAAIAALAHWRIKAKSPSRDVGMAVVATLPLVLSILYQAAAWFNLMGPHPDAMTGVAFITLPWSIAIVSLAAGILCWSLSALMVRVTKNSG